MAPRRALALAIALTFSGCLWARGTSEEPIVTSFKLEGVHAFDPDDVVRVLATRGPERQLIPPVEVGFPLDPDALALDAKRVVAYYRARGYFNTRVERVEVTPDGRGRARVTLHVVEGAPARVRTLTIEGLDEAVDAKKALVRLPVEPGKVFTDADFDATRARILQALNTKGWLRAQVKQFAHVLPDADRVDVSYTATIGPRVRFGPIVVKGATSVPEKLVKDQVEVEVHPGAFFDVSKLAHAQTRVFALGVFSAVRATPAPSAKDETSVPVIVDVEEAPFRTLKAGPGLELESTRWEARGIGSFTNRNFFGNLRRVTIDLQAGYAWLPSALNRQNEGPVGDFAVDLNQPAAFTRYVDADARIELERGLELGFSFWAERLMLGLPLRIAEHWTLVPSYNLEVYELSQVAVSNLTVITEQPLLEGCPNTICLLSYVEERAAWDGRDDPVETHRGYYASLAFQEGTNLGGYGYRYFRFLPEVRAFLPLGDSTIVAARLKIGGLLPIHETGDAPVVARFFAGGPNSQRGYGTRLLSPLDPATGVPIGANGLFDGSLEVRQKMGGSFVGVLFADAAQVAGEGASPTAYQEALAPGALKWAFGGGLRYLTPFGPIRLDIGLLPNRFPLVRHFSDIGPKFPGAIHFSIGEAF